MGNRLPQDQELKTDNKQNDRQHISAGGEYYFAEIMQEFHYNRPMVIQRR